MAPLVRSGQVRDVAPFVRNRLVVVTPATPSRRVRRLESWAARAFGW